MVLCPAVVRRGGESVLRRVRAEPVGCAYTASASPDSGGRATRTRLVQQIDFVAAAPVNQYDVHVVLLSPPGAGIVPSLVFVLNIWSRR